jgi:phosphohistidine phosphatase
VLIRHAKAADAPVDRDRPLAGKGERRATAIGSWLEQAGLLPDRVVVSPARRASQTWELAGAALALDLQPTLDERIYDNTVETVLEAIGDVPDEVQTLAVVGHNPSIGELAASLDDGAGRPAALRELQAGFPTGAVAVFQVDTTFGDLAPGGATLEDFAVPSA